MDQQQRHQKRITSLPIELVYDMFKAIPFSKLMTIFVKLYSTSSALKTVLSADHFKKKILLERERILQLFGSKWTKTLFALPQIGKTFRLLIEMRTPPQLPRHIYPKIQRIPAAQNAPNVPLIFEIFIKNFLLPWSELSTQIRGVFIEHVMHFSIKNSNNDGHHCGEHEENEQICEDFWEHIRNGTNAPADSQSKLLNYYRTLAKRFQQNPNFLDDVTKEELANNFRFDWSNISYNYTQNYRLRWLLESFEVDLARYWLTKFYPSAEQQELELPIWWRKDGPPKCWEREHRCTF